MFRSTTLALVTFLTLSSVPAFAGGRPAGDALAPSPAVAAAWAKEDAKASSSNAVRGLAAAYGVMQGLDIVSTVMARNHGAVEANPVMQGSYAKAVAMKAAMGAVTMVAVRKMEKNHRMAAIATMVAVNVATASIVANNLHNAQHAR